MAAFDFVDSFSYPLTASERRQRRQRLHVALDKEIDSREKSTAVRNEVETVRNEVEVLELLDDSTVLLSRAQQGIEKGLLWGGMARNFIVASNSILKKLLWKGSAKETIEDKVNALSTDFEDGVGFHNPAEMSVERMQLNVEFHVVFTSPLTAPSLHLLHVSLDIALDELVAEKMAEVANAAYVRLEGLEDPELKKYEAVLAAQKALVLREAAQDLVHASYKLLLSFDSEKLKKSRDFYKGGGDKLRKEKAKRLNNLIKFTEKGLKIKEKVNKIQEANITADKWISGSKHVSGNEDEDED